MNYFTVTKIFALISLFTLFCPAVGTAEQEQALKDRLVDALLCRTSSLDVIRETVKFHPFDSGVAATTWGDGLDEQNVIIVQGGLGVAGATASCVRSQFASPYENFQGIVFAEFKGDYKKVVAELNLKPSAKGPSSSLGKFLFPRPKGELDEVCPPTVILTPLDGDRFALGCGWCNG